MNFISIEFLLFFLAFYLIYWNIPGKNRKYLLVLGSAFFYSLFGLNFLFHLILVVFANWFLYRYLYEKTWYVKAIVILNILNLGLFKYFYLFMEFIGFVFLIPVLQKKTSLDAEFSALFHLEGFEVVLPATISYYTFQLISFAVDSKREGFDKDVSLTGFFSFIFFFPVMIAGPILRFDQVRNQFENPTMTPSKLIDGLWLFVRGLVKKGLLSAAVLPLIAPVFLSPKDYSGIALLLTCFLFAANLYFDFSGLTDMARGIGKLMGFDLPENFKAPFFFRSFGDLWRRWHLTFSFWIRDYIYIPLGGSKKGEIRTAINLIVTFMLGGLWHGASLNFLIWGLLTGIYLSLERLFEVRNWRILPEIPYVKAVIRYAFVLVVYSISWTFFFTPNFNSATSSIARILTFQNGQPLIGFETGMYMLLFVFLFHIPEEWPEKYSVPEIWRARFLPILGLIVLFIMIGTNAGNADFFYSRF
ncbi:MBOAT family O-acyltransferase [Leptospira borgpetersenii]|uniref:Acyltransferase n=2 Tax=Leptospira borgpetersenii serovar Hardjo-bovis TaxID=338217 RepID=Q04T61_LEPBJ|nr:MBOAT family O-acyltransferase [Leptospira borgpetersenii]ABJ75909.1 Acyltransferase [Leptospira borgpetersenii serovar Hardjo-bovis str. JB197]ABJ79012.1 Acyltransferase [Leptospira borgpetersenii serovar Hardjo-bovis str. L550]AMX58310.1 acyltransferase [Leptospira borgpetersenii serovar Hardjo]AMX61563.1 acyltransferase [Leptospira borgpetersenii serovar Hardjo]AMX64807.1 acyltransferase [Leptospira borgpetersenii serovar Hardjo]